MSSADRVKSALRRSRLLLVVTTLAGAAALVAYGVIAGPRYEASSSVLLSSKDIGEVVANQGGSSAQEDPQRRTATEAALTRSDDFYRRVAAEVPDQSTSSVRTALNIDAEPGTDVLTFTVTADSRGEAVALANAAADVFPSYRSEIVAAPVRRARQRLEGSSDAGADSSETRASVARLRVLERLTGRNASVVSRDFGADRVRPNPPRDVLIGLAAGLAIGLLIVALREALTTTLRDDEDTEQLLGVPVLAEPGSRVHRSRRKRGRDPLGDRVAYERLALSLEDLKSPGVGCVVAIVSAVPEEGRTTTAARLAAALARRGGNVCAVDGDGSSPTLEHVTSAMNRDDQGPNSPVTADLSGNLGEMSHAIADLRAQYDWIIVDTPAALGSAVPDELARIADSVLLVVRRSRTRKRDVSALLRHSAGWAVQPRGAVLTH